MFYTMFECFKKENMLFELIAFMERNTEGFAESRKNYYDCLNMLRKELGENPSVNVDEFDAALHDAICSDLVYSAYLGFKANLDYFENPLANNFLNIDPEIYLREGTAHRLPAYERAYAKMETFYTQLSPELKEATDAVTDYESHLETTGPKLAHFWAFKKANSFFPSVIPGYCAPMPFTYAYEHTLAKYMGITIIQLNEISIDATAGTSTETPSEAS